MLLPVLLGAVLLASAAGYTEEPAAPCLQPACAADVRAALLGLYQPIRTLQGQLAAVQKQLARCEGSCPDGWSRHGDACYLVPTERADWWAALRACAALDRRARLASLHANSRFVGSLIEGRGEYVWMGLFRPSGSQRWGWADGTALDFTNWLPNEPNNDDGIEGCAVICNWDEHSWNDDKCHYVYSYLCQINLH